ncbi:MAG: hypothetical protein WKG00_12440 [Polyangiaceae bacterium]
MSDTSRRGGAAGEAPMTKREGYQELVDAKVERALAPWVDLLPAEALAEMREQLEDFITTHPAMERMLEELLPAPAVDASGELGPDGKPVPVDTPAAAPGKAGRR